MTVHDINFIYEKSGKKLDKAVRKFEKKLKKSDYLEYISEFAKKRHRKTFWHTSPVKNHLQRHYLPSGHSPRLLPSGRSAAEIPFPYFKPDAQKECGPAGRNDEVSA